MNLYNVKFTLEDHEVEYSGISLDEFLLKIRELNQLFIIKHINYGLLKQNETKQIKTTKTSGKERNS